MTQFCLKSVCEFFLKEFLILIQTSAYKEKREVSYGLVVQSSTLRNTIRIGIEVIRCSPLEWVWSCGFKANSLKSQAYSLLRVQDSDGQVTKGARGMSWYREAMKSVEICEKLGEADKQVMIPRFSN